MLTSKQTAFVEQYLVDLNATQAAIRAGYSASNADKIGSQLLAKPAVADAIDAAKTRRSLEVGMDQRWVLRRLVAEAEADLADLYYPGTNDLKPVEEWPPIWRQGLVTGIDIEALFEGQGKERKQIGYTKRLRLSDRIRRIELIGKHVEVNAFQETVKVRGFDDLGDRLERAFKRIDSAKPTEAVEPLPSSRRDHPI